jgi:hypothetical protein
VPGLLTLIYLRKSRCPKTPHLIRIGSRAPKRQSEKNKIKKLKQMEGIDLLINLSSTCTRSAILGE